MCHSRFQKAKLHQNRIILRGAMYRDIKFLNTEKCKTGQKIHVFWHENKKKSNLEKKTKTFGNLVNDKHHPLHNNTKNISAKHSMLFK